MNNYWAFSPMVDSHDLLDDPDALRARFDRDGYLYLPGAVDPDVVLDLRRQVCEALADVGWIHRRPRLIGARSAIEPVREADEEFFRGLHAVQRLEAFHALAHHPDLLSVMQSVLGPTAFPHPLKIARLSFPEHHEISTPPHQDYPNNQGTESLTAAWVPLGDVPRELGGLAVLRGSHRYGMLPLRVHLGAGERCAVVPDEMLEELRWVTTEFAAGDVLVFGSLTVHAALHNASEFHMRLSADFRYQLEGEALTPICLEPHFQRLTWEDIYADWASEELQYYWKDLDYEVVPFEEFDLVGGDEPTPEEILEREAYERRRAARFERHRHDTPETAGGGVRRLLGRRRPRRDAR